MDDNLVMAPHLLEFVVVVVCALTVKEGKSLLSDVTPVCFLAISEKLRPLDSTISVRGDVDKEGPNASPVNTLSCSTGV